MPVLINADQSIQSSFIASTPPPSYAQAQGMCVAYSFEHYITGSHQFCKYFCDYNRWFKIANSGLFNTATNSQFWSPRATTTVCPRCVTLVITVVEIHQSAVTHMTALALFMIGYLKQLMDN